ncbi:MAG TPA: S53 family peptidase [Streptosporangiaceae bacterium]|nr:S53 family peptidase [Streptosporangiaceae bacterium]
MRTGHSRARAMTRLRRWTLAGATALASATALPGTPLAIAGSGPAVPLPAVTVYPQVVFSGSRTAAAPAGGYTPAQIRAAYFLSPLLRAGIDGRGQSIVIVDSFGSPTIRRDLGVFDRTFGLPAPPALLIIHPAGRIPRFNPGRSDMVSWAAETTLDVEWAHVMAPRARIVLAETPVSENEGTSGFPQIVTAEKYVIAHRLGGVISQSFGATEQTFPKGSLRPLRGAYIEAARPAHDITVVSASGDLGATDYRSDMSLFYTFPVTSWPASDPLVTSVGGLNLSLDSQGRRTAPDRVWNDPGPLNLSGGAGGGGKSVVFSRPAFQNGVAAVVGRHRGVPDVSMSASCGHPVDVYASFAGGSGWSTICGTSEATPMFAGVIALADQVVGHPIGPINAYLYRLAAARDLGITDIVHGDNTVTFTQGGKTHVVPGWKAGPGYDLSSGVGTINAHWFVIDLARMVKAHR